MMLVRRIGLTSIKRGRRPSSYWYARFATATTSQEETTTTTRITATPSQPMEPRQVYRYLQLESFDQDEFQDVFDRIQRSTAIPVAKDSQESEDNNETESIQTDDHISETIHQQVVSQFLLERIRQLEEENGLPNAHDDDTANRLRQEYADLEATRLLEHVSSTTPQEAKSITQQDFVRSLTKMASSVDMKRTLPITISMLLVGSSVGIITPVMPFVVEQLGLTPGQYGMVVSAFAAAKMLGNVPSAVLVERHGRKPYLVYSLSVIALGVGGIGLATSFEHLWACRLLTGAGVAALSTAATLSIADISTPLSRASTMAPIMSVFAAGTALGPALGGYLADSIGIQPTFYLVGVSYLALTAVNHFLLQETKTASITFPWQDETVLRETVDKQSIKEAVKDALGQWAPLMADPRVRNVVIMNGFYWTALAGSQMTLLPLMLTDPSGLNMSATGVGQVFMGMSAIQVFGNPILAKFVDKIGKGPAIVAGSTTIAVSMGLLPLCTDMYQLAGTLGVWATGSTMLSTAPVAYVSDTVDDEKRAQAIALLRTGGDVGFLIGAAGMGALADWTGMDGAMQTSAGVLLTATGWFATRQLMNAKAARKR